MIVKVKLYPDEVVIHGQNGGVLWSSKEKVDLDLGKAVCDRGPAHKAVYDKTERYFMASWLHGKVALHKPVTGYEF